MKKLLLVALFVAIPALVLAQGTTTTTKNPEASKAKVESTTTKPATEAVKTTTTTTKATETKQAVTEPTKTMPTPEMILIGEVVNVDDTNKTFTLKVKETNKEEKISFKSTDPLLKNKTKVKAVYEKDNAGKLWLKKLEESKY